MSLIRKPSLPSPHVFLFNRKVIAEKKRLGHRWVIIILFMGRKLEAMAGCDFTPSRQEYTGQSLKRGWHIHAHVTRTLQGLNLTR